MLFIKKKVFKHLWSVISSIDSDQDTNMEPFTMNAEQDYSRKGVKKRGCSIFIGNRRFFSIASYVRHSIQGFSLLNRSSNMC